MGKGEKDRQNFRRSILGLCVFVLALPALWQMGGADFALRESLPGQVSAAAAPVSAPTSSEQELFGIEDVHFEETPEDFSNGTPIEVSSDLLEKMRDFDYLKQNFYIVDSRTALFPSDIDVEEALSMDFSIDRDTDGPQVLIFHTHSSEGFADSDMSKGLEEGIWGVGERLKEILEQEYGIRVLHDTGRYDVVDGKGQITGAYERMEPPIRQILVENPSIQVCIDMHRDGVAEGTRLVTEIDGKTCAQVMFFNGLCRLNQNGEAQPTPGLSNEYLKENLAFSLQMQVQSMMKYGDFNRKIYLNAYRFSLHMLPRSTLIEVGAQTNTKEEAFNAMEPLADILASVLLREDA